MRTPAHGTFGTLMAVVSTVMMWLVALPRFGAYHEPSLPKLDEFITSGGSRLAAVSVDMREYLRATEYFAGHGPAPSLAPFTARLGAPWLAGHLPWDSPVALNVVVMGILTLGLAALAVALIRLRVSRLGLSAGLVLYGVAFPVFYWGSFNYVDGTVVGLMSIALLMLVLDRPLLAIVVVFVSMLFKEFGLVGVPAIIAWLLTKPDSEFDNTKKVVWSLATVVAAAGGFVVARLIGPRATETYNPWLVGPAEMVNYLGANIGRVGPAAQVFLSGFVPVALTVFAYRRWRSGRLSMPEPMVRACLLGVLASCALNVQALLSAQWDGRSIWMAYPFALALGACALTHPPTDAATTARVDAERRSAG